MGITKSVMSTAGTSRMGKKEKRVFPPYLQMANVWGIQDITLHTFLNA